MPGDLDAPRDSDQVTRASPEAGAPQASGVAALGQPNAPLQPVYLAMTLYGTQAAIDRTQTDPALTIQVRWVRDHEGWTPGDLNLVTDLTIGDGAWPRRSVTMFAARGSSNGTPGQERYLSPGAWTVSVTYPDGHPLACGPDAQPCRFTINVG
jgi:hypothetical protein